MDINQKFPYHSISPEDAAKRVKADLENGLTQEEVKERQKEFGENKLPDKGKKTALMIFLKQFKDFLILILFIAAGIALYVGEMTDVYVILGVILFNAIMGFTQEYNAEKAIESIKKMVKHTSIVYRNGNKENVEAVELVPGDLIEIEEGQTIPADARIVNSKNLQVIEASLTGESVPTSKSTEETEEDVPVADRSSMVFKGTQVGRGSGKAIVTAIGDQTEIGKIASSITEMKQTSSAFKGKTNKLGKKMATFAVTGALIVFCLGYFVRGFAFEEILLVTIAALVAAIPEGLPVVISIVLAIGAKRMAREKAIIREFTATEMLGSVTTIMSDKTGTITQSILTVKKMFINKNLETEVSGKGYQLQGDITADGNKLELGQDPRLDKMALIAAYCNNAEIEQVEEEEEEEENFEEQDERDQHVKRKRKVKRDRKISEDSKFREVKKKKEHHEERTEDGKRITEDHYEETEKKIEKTPEEVEVEKSGETPESEQKKEDQQEENQKAAEEEEPKEKEEKAEQEEQEETKESSETQKSAEDEVPEEEDEENIKVSGDPTEVALLILGRKAKVQFKEPFKNLKIIDDLPFNSETKFRASLVEYPDGKKEIFAVGAPEKILNLSSKIITENESEDLDDQLKEKVREKTDNYTGNAMRVIALAHKPVEEGKDSVSEEDVEDLIWTGITGIIDPPREGVKEAINAAQDAGIRVIMVTGDHKQTARSIAQKVGIIGEGEDSVSSKDLKSDEENFGEHVDSTNVFARVDPDTKLKIADHLRNKGELVGMTGDGVNDAPALKRADVGIAMGQRGTDVAKNASQIILTDDNFSTIVNAIREGRIVFKNVRNTSFFLLTTNFTLVLAIITCIAIGYPLPLLATQILFVNMVTSGIMDVALATEPGHGDAMKQKPYGKDESILTTAILPYGFMIGTVMVIIVVLAFRFYLPEGEPLARTGAFVTAAMMQLYNAFNLRSPQKSVFEIGLFTNKWVIVAFIASVAVQLAAVRIPFMQDIFDFEPLPWLHFLIIFLMSSVILWLGELYKFLKYKSGWKI